MAEQTKRKRTAKKRTLDDVMTNASSLSTIDKAALVKALKRQVDEEIKRANDQLEVLKKAVSDGV